VLVRHPGPTGKKTRSFSTKLDRNGRRSPTFTTTERTALRAEEIRLIPDGQALVIYRNAPAMLLTLSPWTHRPDGPDTAAAIARVRAARHQPPTMTSSDSTGGPQSPLGTPALIHSHCCGTVSRT